MAAKLKHYIQAFWPALIIGILTNVASGSIGAYITIAINREDITWIMRIQDNHERRLEELEHGDIRFWSKDPASKPPGA